MSFDLFVGIDYSGAETPESPLRGLQVFAAETGQEPRVIRSQLAAEGHHGNWSRKAIAEWLLEQIASGRQLFVGIDHGFSFPKSYMDRNRLHSWPEFLDDFCEHWATGDAYHGRDSTGNGYLGSENGRQRDWQLGCADELRLCECWTSWTKGVFQFDVQGSNAMSTHAGIPWLRHLRLLARDSLHFWPFDGWQLALSDRSVIAEVHSPMLRRRYPRSTRTTDEQDAYSVARWLEETVRNGVLDRYLSPPLSHQDREVAALEGWILGVT